MIYQSVSIQQVIARVIRNTRVQDTSYLFDMQEWIPEAMGYMRTKYELTDKYKDVDIHFHKGILPCDLHHIKSVEYKGGRLKEGRGSIAYGNATTDCPIADYYSIEMGCIGTSFMDGTVRIHYAAVPCDEDGLPLIPDNEDYKQALYYYIRAMMVGAGYKDLVFKEDTLMQRYEHHAVRAIGQIRYPSVDSMEQRVNHHVRFFPESNYFDNFFRSTTPEGNL